MLLIHKLARLIKKWSQSYCDHHMNTSWACPEALCTYRKTYGPFLQAFEADALVIKEPPLVGAQHAANKADALVCSRCFTMIGSLEQQMAHRLLSMESPGQLRMSLCTLLLPQCSKCWGEVCMGHSFVRASILPFVLIASATGKSHHPQAVLHARAIQCSEIGLQVSTQTTCGGCGWEQQHSHAQTNSLSQSW